MNALLVLALSGCSEPDGPELYATYCGLCHGVQGEGYLADRANALANPAFLAVADDDFLWVSTARGRPGTSMSAWSVQEEGPLEDEAIDAIVAVVRQWESLEPVDTSAVQVGPGDIESGALLYAEDCSGCHGPEGEGSSALSLDNPEFLASVDDGFLWWSIAEGRPDTPMPAYADQLDAEAIDDLVAFIRTWEGP